MTTRRPFHLASLLDPDPGRRLAAIARAPSEPPAVRYGLRNVLATDADGRVRARAASRLGSRSGQPMIGALVFAACHDELPRVREAAWRALSRARPELLDTTVRAAARDRCAHEPVWWVRMAVAATLARAPGADRVDDLLEVLLDPFWRVRHTAVRALATLGRDDGEVRRRVSAAPRRTDVEGAAILFLERAWLGENAGELEPTPIAPPPSDPLWDPDPAVITARLEDPSCTPSLGLLVELLADAHESTRHLACKHLERRGQLREIRVALQWLDEPRIPYASACATRLANRLGDRASELVRDLLADPPGPGPLCWAAAWVGETRSTELAAAMIELLEHADARVREAAIGALYGTGHARDAAARLFEIAASGAGSERLAAAHALTRIAPERCDELIAAIDLGRAAPRLRRWLTREIAAAEPSAAARLDWLRRAAADDDAATRAAALRALARAGALSPANRRAALEDPDPWIREAVLDADSAAALASSDPCPTVRRAALRLALRQDTALEGKAIAALARDPDPALRTQVAASLDALDAEALGLALRLTFDRWPMVRAAAASRLEAAFALDPLVLEESIQALASSSDDDVVVKAAATWVCRRFDSDSARTLEALWAQPDRSDDARAHLRAIALALPADVGCTVPVAEPTSRPVRARAPITIPVVPTRRELGRTGLSIAPLAISGVKDLDMGSLRKAHDAGVNLYFWEPRYHRLGAFLRRPEIARNTHVVAGTYHGTPEAIENDVEIALRRLRRDHIDLFLVFWVRSAERLSPAVWDCLSRLKRAGKIRAVGFSSHHRDLAADAIESRPWDAMMVRHSAAHTGAEDELLALAQERGVGVLAFTSLCYGRLLQASPARATTRAPDCYRYSLSQPGIDAVISAPARHRELIENLEVLADTELSESAVASMREHGAWVYAQSKDFGALIRRTPRALPQETVAGFDTDAPRADGDA